MEKIKINEELSTQVLKKLVENRQIILHNDDHNTFDHVIDSLEKYCGHSLLQAEQCASIVHYNGKCSVKNGNLKKLKPIHEVLLEKGLTVEII